MPRANWTTSVQTPSWIDTDHILMNGSGVGSFNVQTWQPGRGDEWVQCWFQYVDAIEQDSELSPDGRTLVSVAQTNGALSAKDTLRCFSIPGAAWTEGPYPDATRPRQLITAVRSRRRTRRGMISLLGEGWGALPSRSDL